MTKTEWFRRTSWTPEDQREFEARLKRSRSAFHRAQYLRIQAWHLHEVGDRALAEAALCLLDQVITTYPEPSQLSTALMQRAECLVDLGLPEEALDTYVAALEARRREPRWGNLAHLGFAELVVALKRRDLYPVAVAALDEFQEPPIIPVTEYRDAAVRALVADDLGDTELACACARRALHAAAKTEAPLRYHRKLGLVHSVDPSTHQRVEALAGRPPASEIATVSGPGHR
jgi:tetratricopeptide (TPR) repeat protein